MSFEAALADCARDTDHLLDRLLPPASAGRLGEAMRYAALGPGKRLRPFLVVETARLFAVPVERSLRVGAALECVHCYSLVHDDLPAMDDGDMRRGRPTVHKAFDEATAILAGDALLTFAFEILADRETHPDGAVRSILIAELAKAAGPSGMAGGQMLDLAAVAGDAAGIMRMQAMKTGALFRFACEAGAILGEGERRPFRQYADNFGPAFQITDDILDVTSTKAALGKATQKDSGKTTIVALLGVPSARAKAEELAENAIAALAEFGQAAETLRAAARFAVRRQS
ncbi:MAG: polyprenyl synthetase family protein [Hyphomicrobiales bacterium]